MKRSTILKYFQTKRAEDPAGQLFRELMDAQLSRGEKDPAAVAHPDYVKPTFDASEEKLKEYAKNIENYLKSVPRHTDQQITQDTPFSQMGYAPFFDKIKEWEATFRGWKKEITPRQIMEIVHGKKRADEIIQAIFAAKSKYPLPRNKALAEIYQILHENMDTPITLYLAGPPERGIPGIIPKLPPSVGGVTLILPGMAGRPQSYIFSVPNRVPSNLEGEVMTPEQRAFFLTEAPWHEIMHSILAQRLGTESELVDYSSGPDIARKTIEWHLQSPYLRQQAEIDAFLTGMKFLWHLSNNPVLRTPKDVETMFKVYDSLEKYLTPGQKKYLRLYFWAPKNERLELQSRILQLLGRANKPSNAWNV